MKFLIIFCLLALSVAEEEDTQEKKTQTSENTNAATPQTNQPFNQPFFAPTTFFGNKDAIPAVPFTGFSGNIPNIQNIPNQAFKPEFFTSAQGAINNALPNFQVPRTVLPSTSPVASGIQSQFPTGANVLSSVPGFVNGLTGHFPNIANGLIPPVTGLQGISPEALKYIPINSGVPVIGGTPYRVLPQEGLTNFQTHNLQTPQGLLPTTLSSVQSLANTGFSNIPSGLLPTSQGIFKAPTTTSQGIANISNLPLDKINTVPIPGVFRHA